MPALLPSLKAGRLPGLLLIPLKPSNRNQLGDVRPGGQIWTGWGTHLRGRL